MSWREPSSIPLAATTTTASRGIAAAIAVETARMWADGGARTTTSAPATTAAASCEARMASGSVMSGKKGVLVWRWVISSATSRSNAHIATSCSSRATCAASAVPQAPEPTIAKRAMGGPYICRRVRGEPPDFPGSAPGAAGTEVGACADSDVPAAEPFLDAESFVLRANTLRATSKPHPDASGRRATGSRESDPARLCRSSLRRTDVRCGTAAPVAAPLSRRRDNPRGDHHCASARRGDEPAVLGGGRLHLLLRESHAPLRARRGQALQWLPESRATADRDGGRLGTVRSRPADLHDERNCADGAGAGELLAARLSASRSQRHVAIGLRGGCRQRAPRSRGAEHADESRLVLRRLAGPAVR